MKEETVPFRFDFEFDWLFFFGRSSEGSFEPSVSTISDGIIILTFLFFLVDHRSISAERNEETGAKSKGKLKEKGTGLRLRHFDIERRFGKHIEEFDGESRRVDLVVEEAIELVALHRGHALLQIVLELDREWRERRYFGWEIL